MEIEKVEKRANYVFFIVVILLLISLFIGGNPKFRFSSGEDENGIEWFVSLPKKYQEKFTAESPLKDPFIRLIHDFQYSRLFENRFPIVLGGRDGWLYYTGERNMDDYQNAFPISEDELMQIYVNLEGINRRLAIHDKKLIVVIAPSRETVYPEWLPFGTKKVGNDDRMDQFMAYMEKLQGKTTILDLRDEMLAAKEIYPLLYFKMDTHWNQYGAFIAYQEICKAIQADEKFSDFKCKSWDDYVVETTEYEGDMVKLMPTDLDLKESIPVFVPLFDSPVVQDPPPPLGRDRVEWLYTTIPEELSPNPYTLVSFRDSFSMDLVPFLREDFQEATFEWNFHYNEELVNEKDPDIVIIQVVERYLHVLAWFGN